MILQIADLVHHLLVDGETTGCIHDNHVVTVGLSLLQGMVGDDADILVIRLAIYRNAHLLAYYMELLDSSRTVNVAGYEQWFLALLGFEQISQLTAEGSLTGTLQTTHQDDCRAVFQLQRSFLATHQFSQLVVNQLHHQLSRLHGSEHVHAQRLLLHLVGEFLSHLIVNVGIEECTAHILHGFSHVDFCNLTFTLQDFEGTF